ncbi:13965_t:CDS:2 [Dentiscutata heterogama]|uniref:13965_t:CDS:1 n=1 Tax=Dentiscutata heterogama TaxID=1316150 RepID=A0ACA9LQY3_9GLOM|nr:13965_t:CDS:2 [Dentiscutata heterogama]
MQFEDTKSGWLTKLGGNALRKTWKRRWFVLRGNSLFYYRQKDNPEPAGVINLSTYNSVSQDSSATKKSSYCIRIEKIIRENDSVHSTLSYNSRSIKKSTAFLVFADTESEMQEWISAFEKRLGGRNIVDIVLDRLELSGGMHRRQASYSSLSSFYSRNSGFGSSTGSTSASTFSSRRPSLESLSLDTPPSINSRKSSIDSFNGVQHTPSNLVAMFGLGQPILRKPASCSGLQDKKTNNTGGGSTSIPHNTHVRKLSLTFNKEPVRAQTAPLIMVHGENTKVTSSLDTIYFPNNHSNHVIKSSPLGRKKATYLDQSKEITPSSPITPLANVFPSHLN